MSIEPRPRGLAVHAPCFSVWDSHPQGALAWADDLRRVLPGTGSGSPGRREGR